MSRIQRTALAFLFTAAAAAAPASAAILVFDATLTGSQERPTPVNTPGIGTGLVTFNTTTHMMRVEVSFSGLLANTTVAHIHNGAKGVSGPVWTTTPTFPGFPAGVTSGAYDQTFDMTLASSYNPSFLNNAINLGSTASAEATFLAALRAGNMYLNVHSTMFPAGEIRGQLAEVPEPGTWALMIGGFGIVGAALRRRVKVAYA